MNFLHDEDGAMSLPADSQSSTVSPRRIAHRAVPPTDAVVAATESSLPPPSTSSAPAAAFSFRKVTLDRPVAPLLAQPMAPFAKKSNRKKAFMSASFYSECFLNGISPIDADTAAMDAQSRYDKWWKSTRYAASQQQEHQEQLEQQQHPGKRQKRLLDHYEQQHQQQAQSPLDVVVGQKLIPSSNSSSPSSLVGGAMQFHRRLSRQDSVVSSEGEDSKQQDNKKQQLLLHQKKNHHHHHHHHHRHKRQLVLLDSDIDVIRPVDHGYCRFEQNEINQAKADLVQDLKASGGDTDRSSKFLACLDFLQAFYNAQGCDARWTSHDATCMSDGAWLNLTKPTFSDCLGQNENGQYIYTLGRLAFDMFRPTNLRCILRGVFNAVGLPSEEHDGDDERPRSFPSGMYMPSSRTCLQQQQLGRPIVRNNDIVVSFTIEANQTRRGKPASSVANEGGGKTTPSSSEYIVRRPIRGLLTNHGYCVPDPNVPNRLSVWFSGGSLEVQDEIHDLEEWKQLFDENEAPRRDLGELARVLAAKCLLGAHLPHSMEEDGSLTYFLKRPIGGHGQVFVDVLYCDETLRIVRGHRGSIYASIRSL